MGLMFSVLEHHKGTSNLEDAVARRSHFSWGIFNSQSTQQFLSCSFFNIETARMTVINEIGDVYVLLAP